MDAIILYFVLYFNSVEGCQNTKEPNSDSIRATTFFNLFFNIPLVQIIQLFTLHLMHQLQGKNYITT